MAQDCSGMHTRSPTPRLLVVRSGNSPRQFPTGQRHNPQAFTRRTTRAPARVHSLRYANETRVTTKTHGNRGLTTRPLPWYPLVTTAPRPRLPHALQSPICCHLSSVILEMLHAKFMQCGSLRVQAGCGEQNLFLITERYLAG